MWTTTATRTVEVALLLLEVLVAAQGQVPQPRAVRQWSAPRPRSARACKHHHSGEPPVWHSHTTTSTALKTNG